MISAGYEMTPAQQSLLYDRLKYLPALSRLSASKSVLGFCKELGLGMPSLMGSSNMRLDKPGDDRHLFAWHQDTLYLLGSTNAVTIGPARQRELIRGTIQVIPGSHKLGILPFKRISDKPILKNLPFLQRDLALDVDVSEEPHTMIATRGDVVVFKQMLLAGARQTTLAKFGGLLSSELRTLPSPNSCGSTSQQVIRLTSSSSIIRALNLPSTLAAKSGPARASRSSSGQRPSMIRNRIPSTR